MDAISDETHCPFSKTPVDKAYGPEVSMFLHCHLRGYDRHGEGKVSDNGKTILIGIFTREQNYKINIAHIINILMQFSPRDLRSELQGQGCCKRKINVNLHISGEASPII